MIRGRIAGMKGHHHIHAVLAFKIRDIPLKEIQPAIPVFLRKAAAAADHIRLQIQARHTDIQPAQLVQIIVHGESQIAFPASEINDPHTPVLWEYGHDVRDKFQETVDLAEFIIPALHRFPLRRLNPKIDQKGNRLSFLQNIFLLPVMRHPQGFRHCFRRVRSSLAFPDRHLAFFAHYRLRLKAPRLYGKLTETRHGFQNSLQRLLLCQISVKDLIPAEAFQLKKKPVPEHDRPDLKPHIRVLSPRASRRHLIQLSRKTFLYENAQFFHLPFPFSRS